MEKFIHFVVNGGKDIAELLINNSINKEMNDHNINVFMKLVSKGNTDIVELLLKIGMEVDLIDSNGHTALVYGVYNAKKVMVELLIKYGASVEVTIETEATMLIIAASRGDTSIIKVLLDNGANKEAIDKDSMTALICAAEHGHTEAVELLIQEGADIEAQDLEGKDALIFSIRGSHVKVAKLLILHGANVNAIGFANKTVLMYAARIGQMTILELLLERGADVKAIDADGYTAIDHAIKNNHKSSAYRLLCEIVCEKRDLFETDDPEKRNLVDEFVVELLQNKEKIYSAIMPPFKLNVDPTRECHFGLLPLELIKYIKVLEARLQGFSDWYQHRVDRDINLAFNFIFTEKKTKPVTYFMPAAAPAITPAFLSKKTKISTSILCKDNPDQNSNIDLNNLQTAFLNLSLN